MSNTNNTNKQKRLQTVVMAMDKKDLRLIIFKRGGLLCSGSMAMSISVHRPMVPNATTRAKLHQAMTASTDSWVMSLPSLGLETAFTSPFSCRPLNTYHTATNTISEGLIYTMTQELSPLPSAGLGDDPPSQSLTIWTI